MTASLSGPARFVAGVVGTMAVLVGITLAVLGAESIVSVWVAIPLALVLTVAGACFLLLGRG